MKVIKVYKGQIFCVFEFWPLFVFPQHDGSDGSDDNTGLRNARDPFREDCLYFESSSSRILIRLSYDFNSSLKR